MNRQDSQPCVSIARRIEQLPVNAAHREMALDQFLACERTVNRLAKALAALRRFAMPASDPARHAAGFTRTSSSRMAAP